MNIKRIKTSLGLYDDDSYLRCLPKDLHDDLLNHLGNDVKCLIDIGTWRHFILKIGKHVCTFAISTLFEFLSWFNNQLPNDLQKYLYGTYCSNTCKYLFTKRLNRLQIFISVYCNDDEEIILDNIQSLIVNYKLIQLYDEYMKYCQLISTLRVVF